MIWYPLYLSSVFQNNTAEFFKQYIVLWSVVRAFVTVAGIVRFAFDIRRRAFISAFVCLFIVIFFNMIAVLLGWLIFILVLISLVKWAMKKYKSVSSRPTIVPVENTMEQQEARIIMKKVGRVLIIVGIIDIIYMFWRVSKGTVYSSSFNILAVIGGIFLIRGNFKEARTIGGLANFMLFGLLCFLVLSPALIPMELVAIYIKLYPAAALIIIIDWGVTLALLYWITKWFSRPPVTTAIIQAGLDSKWKRPVAARYVGIGFSIIMFIFLQFHNNSPEALTSINKAKEKYGAEHKYFLYNLTSLGTDVNATIKVYNKNEIITYEVTWQKPIIPKSK
jgi:hypothetical protein